MVRSFWFSRQVKDKFVFQKGPYLFLKDLIVLEKHPYLLIKELMFGTRIHRTWRRIRQNLYQDSEHSGRRKCSFLKPDKGYRTDWESKIKQCDD